MKDVRRPLGAAVALGVACCLGCGPERPPSGPREAEPTLDQAAQPEPAQFPPVPAPEAKDVRACLARIFAGVVVADPSRGRWYLDGDFNGDGSVDLAVAARPIAAGLAALNDPLANWIVEDPRRPRSPKTSLAASDALLAVVHGHGPDGWRNPDARQTYVLRNTGGSRMLAVPTSEAVTPVAGHERVGHVIRETLDGSSGMLYWNGARYAWTAAGDGILLTVPPTVAGTGHAAQVSLSSPMRRKP
jgi:hypothetical protein